MSELTPEAATPSPEAAPSVETPVAETPVAETPTPESPIVDNNVAPPSEPAPQPETPAESVIAPPERVVPAADGYTLPEGTPAEFGQLANSLGYTQEQADGTFQALGGYVNAISEGERNANVEAGQAYIAGLGEESTAILGDAKKGLEYIDEDGSLKDMLQNSNGYDFNPAILKSLAKVGKMLQEGTFVKGNGNNPLPKDNQSRAHRMYPNDAPKN